MSALGGAIYVLPHRTPHLARTFTPRLHLGGLFAPDRQVILGGEGGIDQVLIQ